MKSNFPAAEVNFSPKKWFGWRRGSTKTPLNGFFRASLGNLEWHCFQKLLKPAPLQEYDQNSKTSEKQRNERQEIILCS